MQRIIFGLPATTPAKKAGRRKTNTVGKTFIVRVEPRKWPDYLPMQ
jgi:hypothetical protein